jgi:hypothetical protein
MAIRDFPVLIDDPQHPGKHIDTETGCWPISEWGNACYRGFVSSERFATQNDAVMPKSNRAALRKWRKLDDSRGK